MGIGAAGSDRWTAARVGEAMIEAFRALPDMPIYSSRRAEVVPALAGHDPSPLDVVGISERVLGHAAPERRALLIWARAKARARIRRDRRLRTTRAVPGSSVAEHCQRMGACRRTFDRQRWRACGRIAAELNRIGDEAAAALEALRREAPALAAMVVRL